MNVKKRINSKVAHSHMSVLGITSEFDEFRFCNLLHSELELDFAVSEQIPIDIHGKNLGEYPIYTCYDEREMVLYELVSNTLINEVKLVSFLDSITFFLRCSFDTYAEDTSEHLIARLKKLQAVLFVQRIEQGNYSTKQRAVLRKLFSNV